MLYITIFATVSLLFIIVSHAYLLYKKNYPSLTTLPTRMLKDLYYVLKVNKDNKLVCFTQDNENSQFLCRYEQGILMGFIETILKARGEKL